MMHYIFIFLFWPHLLGMGFPRFMYSPGCISTAFHYCLGSFTLAWGSPPVFALGQLWLVHCLQFVYLEMPSSSLCINCTKEQISYDISIHASFRHIYPVTNFLIPSYSLPSSLFVRTYHLTFILSFHLCVPENPWYLLLYQLFSPNMTISSSIHFQQIALNLELAIWLV